MRVCDDDSGYFLPASGGTSSNHGQGSDVFTLLPFFKIWIFMSDSC